MTAEPVAGLTLRERKKLAVREALSWAAVRLATERGLEHVRVEEIAAAVGVSARTFNNYFSSKEEAVCSIGIDRQARIRDELLGRPAEEPLWDAVINAIVRQYASHGEPDRAYVQRVRLMIANSSLRGEFLKSHAMVERVLAEGIAERAGVDIEQDIRPRLLAGVVTSTVRVATSHWLATDGDAPFERTLTQALRAVSTGMPGFTGHRTSLAHQQKESPC